jgi:hypothetical protein
MVEPERVPGFVIQRHAPVLADEIRAHEHGTGRAPPAGVHSVSGEQRRRGVDRHTLLARGRDTTTGPVGDRVVHDRPGLRVCGHDVLIGRRGGWGEQ